MKKGIKTKNLSRTANERKQLFRNLIRTAALSGYVETTLAKAKAVKPVLEKLVTRAKANTLAGTRSLVAETGDVDVARRLTDLGKLFAKRPGGYLRLIRMGARPGDNTEMVRLEWVEKLAIAETVTQAKTQPEPKVAAKETQTKLTDKQKPVPKEKRK